MKTTKLLSILSVALMFAFYGCKKSSTKPTPIVTNQMTFTLRGQNYTVPTPYTVTNDGSNITLNGGSQSGMYMTMYISDYKSGDPNFPVDGSLNYITFQTSSAAGNKYFFSGVLKISSLTQTHISGTFSGLAVVWGDPLATSYTLTGTYEADIPQ